MLATTPSMNILQQVIGADVDAFLSFDQHQLVRYNSDAEIISHACASPRLGSMTHRSRRPLTAISFRSLRHDATPRRSWRFSPTGTLEDCREIAHALRDIPRVSSRLLPECAISPAGWSGYSRAEAAPLASIFAFTRRATPARRWSRLSYRPAHARHFYRARRRQYRGAFIDYHARASFSRCAVPASSG